jgi:hypothetical protein
MTGRIHLVLRQDPLASDAFTFDMHRMVRAVSYRHRGGRCTSLQNLALLRQEIRTQLLGRLPYVRILRSSFQEA